MSRYAIKRQAIEAWEAKSLPPGARAGLAGALGFKGVEKTQPSAILSRLAATWGIPAPPCSCETDARHVLAGAMWALHAANSE